MNLQHNPNTAAARLGRLCAPILATALLASALMAGSHSVSAQDAASVDINTATAEQLAASIRGVGIKRAEAIVSYRETHGPFASVDELVEVSGVGQTTVDSNRALLTVGEQQSIVQSN